MSSRVEEFASQLQASWPEILGARKQALAKRDELSTLLLDHGTSDAALVAFGSLARGEWTSGSDLDWTLLIDGPAKRDQWSTVHQVRKKLETGGFKSPNPGGAFGSMAFSHELVHRIGGDSDTNRITTQRVLLLLESVAIGATAEESVEVHGRVLRAVLDSYLEDLSPKTEVPHLLLNDVVRYWRTLTVDFSAKARERGNQGWALRHLKLRTSRKLIFAAGLVMCLERTAVPNSQEVNVATKENARADLLERLVSKASETPLDRLAGAALTNDEMKTLARPVFDTYERFLSLVNDATKRKRLSEVTRDEASGDDTYKDARIIGEAFGNAIENFFFDNSSVYSKAIRKYGVF